MKSQDYQSHARIHPLFHYVLLGLLLATLVVSILNLKESVNLQSILLLLIVVTMAIIVVLVRIYPMKNQDRIIRAEENFRHYVLTGKLLDPKLTNRQVIALRFADDQEFPGMCEKAVQENMKSDDIKKAIVNWKADHNRV